MAVSQSILKTALEEGTVGPQVLTVTVWFSIHVIADIFIAVCESLYSFSVL